MKRSRISVAVLSLLFSALGLPAASASPSDQTEEAAVREAPAPRVVDRDGVERDVLLMPAVADVAADGDPVAPEEPGEASGLPAWEDTAEPTGPDETDEPSGPAPGDLEEPADPDEPADLEEAGDPVPPSSEGEELGSPVDVGQPKEDGVAVLALPVLRCVVIDGAPGYLLPLDGGGFTWFINGTPATELVESGAVRLILGPDDDFADAPGGWYEVSGDGLGMDIAGAVLAAAADPGYAFVTLDGGTVTVHYAVDARTPVELEPPTALDGAGTADFFLVPEVEGQVVGGRDGQVFAPGEHPVVVDYVDGTATVDLTVGAAAGHRLEREGVVLDSTPGRSAEHPVQLVFTDELLVAEGPVGTEPVDERDAVVDRPAAGEPSEEVDAPIAVVPAVLTIADHAPEAAPEPEPAPEATAEAAAEETTQRSSESGIAGVETTVLLAVLFLGAAGTVFGFGRDAA